MRLIVTRPEPDATRTAEALIRLGHAAILSPMLDIEPSKNVRLPKKLFQAVLITSSNAVRILAGHPDRATIADVPLMAVGDRSALEARRAGFAEARSAGGAVGDLVQMLGAKLSPADGPLLYVAGEAQAGDLGGKLVALGFEVETSVIYRSVPRSRLSGVATDALRSRAADGVLFYSPRSAAAFATALSAQALAPLTEAIACFCISAASAAPLAAITTGPVLVAERPDQISLFAEIERFGGAAPSRAGHL